MVIVREVGLPSSGDGDKGNEFRRHERVCAEEAEYGRAIHCNTIDSGPLKRGGKDAGGVGENKVVVTGGTETARIESGDNRTGIR